MFLNLSENNNEKLQERVKFALLGYSAGLYEWNMLDNSAFYSAEWTKMLGYSYSSITPHLSTWSDLVHPDDLNTVIQNVNKTILNKKSHIEAIHRLKHKDGSWKWILGRGFITYNQNGDAIKMTGIHTDITEQKTNELKLKYHAQIIEQTQESIITINFKGDILTWNNGAKLMFGYAKDEIVGKDFLVLCENSSIHKLSDTIHYTLKNGTFSKEEILKSKNQKTIHAKVSMYIFKDDLDNPVSITIHIHDITSEIEAKKILLAEKKKLQFQATHDTLTNLPNRLLFEDRLEISLIKAKRDNSKIALFFIDLDNFKYVNDSYGHDIGDLVLKEVAKRLKQSIRKEDTLSRLGGDEFTILFEKLKSIEDALILVKKIQGSLFIPMYIVKQKLDISCSIGISFYPDDANNSSDLVKNADSAMYKAKLKQGSNNYSLFEC